MHIKVPKTIEKNIIFHIIGTATKVNKNFPSSPSIFPLINFPFDSLRSLNNCCGRTRLHLVKPVTFTILDEKNAAIFLLQ